VSSAPGFFIPARFSAPSHCLIPRPMIFPVRSSSSFAGQTPCSDRFSLGLEVTSPYCASAQLFSCLGQVRSSPGPVGLLQRSVLWVSCSGLSCCCAPTISCCKPKPRGWSALLPFATGSPSFLFGLIKIFVTGLWPHAQGFHARLFVYRRFSFCFPAVHHAQERLPLCLCSQSVRQNVCKAVSIFGLR
jgi:hypothetical protein